MNNNIFSTFYTKVINFFQKEKESQGENTKSTAQNRLKLVLMQDRSNLDGAAMQKMREQLIEVISKYIEIDEEALDLNLEAEGEEIALMLNIPVIKARTREEIDALVEAEKEAKKKEIEDAVAAALAEREESQDEDTEENSEDSDEESTEEPNENTEVNQEESGEASESTDEPDEEKSSDEQQDEESNDETVEADSEADSEHKTKSKKKKK